jgi:hypothetical protein
MAPLRVVLFCSATLTVLMSSQVISCEGLAVHLRVDGRRWNRRCPSDPRQPHDEYADAALSLASP